MATFRSILFWAALPIWLAQSGANAQVIVGDCNIVIRERHTQVGSITVGDYGCPQDPTKMLRVSYFWLDATSASFLLTGAIDERLTRLLGRSPIIVQNDVIQTWSQIVNRFGVRRNITQNQEGSSFYIGTGNYGPSSQSSEMKDLKFSQKIDSIRAYETDTQIYWPDYEAILTSYKTTGWPSDYKIYYREADGDGGFQDIFNKTILWKNINRSDLENYRETTARAIPELLKNPSTIHFDQVPGPTEKEEEQFSKDTEKLDDEKQEQARASFTLRKATGFSRSISAMLYFTQENWPADFLQAYAFMINHVGSSIGVTFAVIPRRPYLQIAVIENIGGSGAHYNLQGFSIERSIETGLRAERDNIATRTDFLAFPPAKIGRGDKVVLPLAIELRTHTDVSREDVPESIAPSAAAARSLLARLRSLPADKIISAADVQKTVSAFPAASPPQPTRTYYFGPKITLRTMDLDTQRIAVRQHKANEVYMVSGFEGGSCPILYTRTANQPDLAKIGPVLRTAHGPSNAMTQTIELDPSVVEIALNEEEPERTLIRSLVVYRLKASGERQELVRLDRPLTLDFEEGLSATIPKQEGESRLFLEIEGYYQPYGEMLISAADTGRAPPRTSR